MEWSVDEMEMEMEMGTGSGELLGDRMHATPRCNNSLTVGEHGICCEYDSMIHSTFKTQ